MNEQEPPKPLVHSHPHDHGDGDPGHDHEDGFQGVHDHPHTHVEMTLADFFHAWFGHEAPLATPAPRPPERRP